MGNGIHLLLFFSLSSSLLAHGDKQGRRLNHHHYMCSTPHSHHLGFMISPSCYSHHLGFMISPSHLSLKATQPLSDRRLVFILWGLCSHTTFPLSECDIEYINPSAYEPPPDGSTNGSKNGFDDDPYERIVRSSLQHLEKQKVRSFAGITTCLPTLSTASPGSCSTNFFM